jgi:hypothetical protein
MKHEWRKSEKEFYTPKAKPSLIDIPTFQFFTILGEGNPNDDHFPDYIQVLYALSYGVRMSHKKGIAPKDYFEYTVYPLEGIWDLNEEAKKSHDGSIDKDDLVFKLMIRQPAFVDAFFAQMIIERTKQLKPHPLIEHVQFEKIEEGLCVQMMHLGSYDDEPRSFREMELFTENQNLIRVSKAHREIYLSDVRKVAPENLKTVLRFQVNHK